MATNFPTPPAGVNTPYDSFTEPTSPAQTSLSSGNGRNHYEHHRDLGDAVEAIERNVALKTHDHSGGSGDFATSQLSAANTHLSNSAPASRAAALLLADTDKSVNSLHHTLGSLGTQAAPGDHGHDYDTLTNRPFIRCTSLTRPSSPTLGTWIWETDTNRARVWTQFTNNNVAVEGLNSTDDFERTSASNMGTSLWSQTYTIAGTHGIMATPDGHNLSWTDQGTDPGRCIARRIKSSDATTTTDDQIITWQTGAQVIEYHLPWITTSATNDMYFRMSSDGQSYLRLAFTFSEWGQGYVTLYTTKTGPAGEKRIAALAADTRQAWTYWTAELIGNAVSVYSGAAFIGKLVDVNNTANKGSSYRGWGIGMSGGDHLVIGQTTPSNIAQVSIRDANYYTGAPIWQLLPIGAMPTVSLRQQTKQQLLPGGSSILWDTEVDDNFNYWDRNGDRTQIIVKEPGLYQIDAAIQWDPSLVPDVATAAIFKGASTTELRQQQFMRGNTWTPGFSQTISVSGKLRLAANSVLSLRASYTGTDNLIDKVFSFADGNTQILSRIDIAYLGP